MRIIPLAISICIPIAVSALYFSSRSEDLENQNRSFAKSEFAKAKVVLDKSFAKPYQEERAFPTRFRKEDTKLVWRLSYIGFDSLAQALERFDRAIGIPAGSKEPTEYDKDCERFQFCRVSQMLYVTHNGVSKIFHEFADGNPGFPWEARSVDVPKGTISYAITYQNHKVHILVIEWIRSH